MIQAVFCFEIAVKLFPSLDEYSSVFPILVVAWIRINTLSQRSCWYQSGLAATWLSTCASSGVELFTLFQGGLPNYKRLLNNSSFFSFIIINLASTCSGFCCYPTIPSIQGKTGKWKVNCYVVRWRTIWKWKNSDCVKSTDYSIGLCHLLNGGERLSFWPTDNTQ